MIQPYLEFLRYSIGDNHPLPECAKSIDWIELLAWAEQQAIVGVIFGGIQRAGKNLNIPFDALMEWVGYSNQIEVKNRTVNKRCIELTDKLRADGFECCILKGQGNALLYPNPYLRTPGDIDAWVGSNVNKIIEYARRKNHEGMACYHHVDYGDFYGIEVELHYKLTFMASPIFNRRLRKWIEESQPQVFNHLVCLPNEEGEICTPTVEFNLIYQLYHIVRHVFDNGIGLRQIIDYYYLLKTVNHKSININEDFKAKLKNLGLYHFAGAVMYVLHKVLGMEEHLLIVPADERRGKFLLKEILCGGNFGRYDTRGHLVTWNNPVGSLLRHAERDLRLVWYFPSESLWEPVFRVYHFGWRLVH